MSDIFERAVQDPCSNDVDDADNNTNDDFSLINNQNVVVPQAPPLHHQLRKVQTAPHFHNHDKQIDYNMNSRDDNLLLQRSHTYSRPYCCSTNRTDSSLFVQQAARRPSFIKQSGSEQTLLSLNNNYYNNEDISSCNAIPTHVYGLEKYVSPQLDELSTDEIYCNQSNNEGITTDSSVFDNKDYSNIKNITSSSSLASSSSPTNNNNNTKSHHNHNHNHNRHTVRHNSSTSEQVQGNLPVMERRPSTIKISLANSFA
ncbi:similar to Saccharomyces cerevisiae YMR081C ISF1 Serine-rich, hydrophilic protein with similarity to Mbr1p [Maudiozyma saulgeensis]|uniref:Similar to Saccharomyces cerevisiae YMR081C ISF1 Serine-rich, hydrophilic protein with similarity to Mbr1p n=1 Tax=Maudiozyma saulgeensis TaxID=1789683 RepID=A0A1X7R860_9SACH|nr:similar to Saccharomyces cerevisiae YMR081C ISF1 Serine-rich, hydrophilic protein with similarity to Mbr1p [Kazachstania saulgeensis]